MVGIRFYSVVIYGAEHLPSVITDGSYICVPLDFWRALEAHRCSGLGESATNRRNHLKCRMKLPTSPSHEYLSEKKPCNQFFNALLYRQIPLINISSVEYYDELGEKEWVIQHLVKSRPKMHFSTDVRVGGYLSVIKRPETEYWFSSYTCTPFLRDGYKNILNSYLIFWPTHLKFISQIQVVSEFLPYRQSVSRTLIFHLYEKHENIDSIN